MIVIASLVTLLLWLVLVVSYCGILYGFGPGGDGWPGFADGAKLGLKAGLVSSLFFGLIVVSALVLFVVWNWAVTA